MSEQTENDTLRQASQRSAAITIGLPAIGLVLIVAALLWGFRGSQAPVTLEPSSASTKPAPILESVAPVETPLPESTPATTPTPAPQVNVPPSLTVDALNKLLPDRASSWGIGPLGTTISQQSNAIERSVAMIDNLRQGEVPYKLLPVARPKQAFSILDNGLAVTVNPESYARYNGLIQTLGGLNITGTVTFFRQHEATLNEAWAALGYADMSLEQAIITALDTMLLTPEVPSNARLLKKEANWVYEDETLEALPAIQKQLIRMGPENSAALQSLARELRGAILDSAK